MTFRLSIGHWLPAWHVIDFGLLASKRQLSYDANRTVGGDSDNTLTLSGDSN
jgi:hypothetical protein